MAYSEKAKALRKCKAKKKNGEPCQAWAVLGEDFCMAHSGRHHRGPIPQPWERREAYLEDLAYWVYRISKEKLLFPSKKLPRQSPVCHCPAYNWPHRPGGGLCQWPDPPTKRCTIPAGTHGWPRLR